MSIVVSTFVACSLDGYIAASDGDIGWLERANRSVPPGEDCGYAAFLSTIDALVLGRKTFQQASSSEQWPFAGKRVVVLSRSDALSQSALPLGVEVVSQPPRTLLGRLRSEGIRHLYVDGPTTIQSFLEDALIDLMTITTIPVLLGSGKPLFGRLSAEVELVHLSTLTYAFGFVQCRYGVKKPLHRE
jgi:dihydrofolate reductase